MIFEGLFWRCFVKIIAAPKQPVRHLPVMADYSLLSNPMKRGHKFLLSLAAIA
jgi:hypothetical protein